MKIAVITPGRSHLLDMSVQFIKLGHEVMFYTIVPKSRCEKFGLNRGNVVSFFYVCAPLMFLFRKFKFPFDGNRFIYYLVCRIVDYLSSLYIKQCDIAITISGCSVKAIKKAKQKYGAFIICDRGAKHIIVQDEILKKIPTAKQVYRRDIPIELRQYEMADMIALPSQHTIESFISQGFDENKLFVNPYGVNIDLFHPVSNITPKYDVIFVGNWSYQKGCDLLTEACERGQFTLLHVGNIIDCPFPQNSNSIHIDAVSQLELVDYYAKAKVLALPSRQDGFGLVLFQAMACGLPLVYSHETGGPDLRNLITKKEFLFEMKDYTVDSLVEALGHAVNISKSLLNQRNYLTPKDKQQISWEAYGKRYNSFLISKSRR